MAKNDKAVKPTKKVRQRANKRPLTDTFTAICLSELRMEVVKEFQFHPTRLWRFDYAIPSHKRAAYSRKDGIREGLDSSATSRSTMRRHGSAGGSSGQFHGSCTLTRRLSS